MKSLSAVALLSLAALVDAHGDHAHRAMLHARQASTSGASSGTPAASGTSLGGAPPSTFTFSLKATNPTAIPLASITAGVSSRPHPTLKSSAVPLSVPSAVAGAPALPDVSTFNPRNYPELDQVPPVDSPEVLAWLDEIKNSGITIPGLTPTKEGGCPANPELVNDPDRCWWTCGGCVTEDDITECNAQNHWGLTFDDGPGYYTPSLLEYLDSQQLKATFFIVGSRVGTFTHTLQAEFAAGHQIAVHTWSHRALTTLTTEQVVAELGWTKKIIRDTLGVTPNQMRPPFGDIDNRVRAISLAMGLTPVMWTRSQSGVVFNTQDFDINGGKSVDEVLSTWKTILTTVPTLEKGFIVLEHDLNQQTIDVATGYILPDGLAQNPALTIEPVITCVDMPNANAYIETNNNSTNPPKAKLGVRTQGAKSDAGANTVGAMLVGGVTFAAGLFSLF